MTRLRALRLCTVCLLAAMFMLSACVSSKSIKYYRLEVPEAPAVARTRLNVALQVGNIEAPPLMRDGRILYQTGHHEIGAYEYHRWLNSPDRMVQDSLIRLLRSSGRYSSVDGRSSSARPDYTVQGQIYEFSEIDSQQVQTRISIEIELQDAKTGRSVWSRVYKHDEPVSGKEVSDVVDSLDRNLKQGLAEIVTALDQYFASLER